MYRKSTLFIMASSSLKQTLTFIVLLTYTMLSQAQTHYPAGLGNDNLAIWLDANTLTEANGTPIQTWADLSGNNRNATQANTGIQPTLISNALNGNATLRFDGVDDFMQLGAIPAFDNNTSFTTFTVFQSLNTTNKSAIFYSDYNTNVPRWGLYTNEDTNPILANYIFFEAIDGTSNNIFKRYQHFVTGSDTPPSPYVLATGVWNGTSGNNTQLLELYRNTGIDSEFSEGVITAPSASPGTHSNTTLGAFPNGTNFLEGDIAEVIIYDMVLNKVQRELVENYLMAKYNLPNLGTVYYQPPAPTQYIKGISGIGRGGASSQTTASSEGLRIQSGITANDFLSGDGSYLMYGYQSINNQLVTQNLPSSSISNRWQRDWYLDFTENPTGNLEFTFDFSEGGVALTPSGTYVLLYRAAQSGDYEVVAISDDIVNTDQVVFNLDITELGDGYYTLGTYIKPPGSGNALAFDGINDFVEMPNNAQVNFGTGSFTIEAWVKTTDADAVLFETEGDGNRVRLRITGGSLEAVIDGSLGTFTLSGNTINNDKWTHIALVHTMGTGNSVLYINGVDVAGNNITDVGNTDTNDSWFIGRAAGGGDFFNGQIDEIRIWNRARLESEIRERMCSFLKSTDLNYDDLVLYFPFDETASEPTALDLINVQTATLSGFDFNGTTSGWRTSGARIGDYSTFNYGATAISNYNPAETPLNDQLSVAIATGGTPIAIHLYYVEGEPNVRTMPVCVTDFDGTGYWGVFIVGDGSYVYEATYLYDPMSININFEVNLELIFRENNASTAWQCAAPAAITFNEAANTIRITGLTGTELLMAGPDGALPINLLSFEVNQYDENSLRLDWVTASETNNAYFDLERSADGQTFETVTRIDGQGTTLERTAYTWIDAQPLSGENYYRLKQTDFDGIFSYSNIVYYDFTQAWQVSTYPNPTQSKLYIRSSEQLSEKVTLGLFNQQGQQVQTWQLAKDSAEYEISLEGLPQGVYFLKTFNSAYPLSTKIVKY